MRYEFFCQENWRKRFLPHYDAEEKLQAITYRLVDSLPREVLSKLSQENSESKDSAKYRAQVDEYLDCGLGDSFLAQERIAEIVVGAWMYFHQTRYEIIAYVVMPNHVHILVKTYPDWSLDKIVHSWKSLLILIQP